MKQRWMALLLVVAAGRAEAASPLAVEAQHGMVVSSQRLASEIGAEILKEGGNAIDAAIACALAPEARSYMFAGHRSQEPGHRILLERLTLRPILDLDMRLGEGTGAVLALPVIEAAVHIYTEMATFSSAGVSGAAR